MLLEIGQLWSSDCGVKRLKGVHPLVDQRCSYVRLAAPLLDIAVISTEFCGRLVLSFVSRAR